MKRKASHTELLTMGLYAIPLFVYVLAMWVRHLEPPPPCCDFAAVGVFGYPAFMIARGRSHLWDIMPLVVVIPAGFFTWVAFQMQNPLETWIVAGTCWAAWVLVCWYRFAVWPNLKMAEENESPSGINPPAEPRASGSDRASESAERDIRR